MCDMLCVVFLEPLLTSCSLRQQLWRHMNVYTKFRQK